MKRVLGRDVGVKGLICENCKSLNPVSLEGFDRDLEVLIVHGRNQSYSLGLHTELIRQIGMHAVGGGREIPTEYPVVQ